MKFSQLSFFVLMAFGLLVSCTGQKGPLNKHEEPKVAGFETKDPEKQKYASTEINLIENDEERLKKAEEFLSNEFPKSELIVKYSSDTKKLISFAIKMWAKKGQINQFSKLVEFVFSDSEVDVRIIEAFEIVETKSLIYKAASTTKDPVFKFKLILLLKKIQPVGISQDDLAFMQNQLNSIKNETEFKFTNSSQVWIKANRDLIEKLVASGAEGKVQFDEKEFEGVSISRTQRETMLVSFLKTKKNLGSILSPMATKEMKEYKSSLERIRKDLPLFSAKIKLNEISDENVLGIIISLLISDLDSIQIGNLIKMNLIETTKLKSSLEDWVNYEIAQIVRKYKEEFLQFQTKKINYTTQDYFPEMKKSLAMSQMMSRERVERLRVFMSVSKVLGSEVLHKKLIDLDIFFKRLLTSNTTLLILKLFSENSVQLKTEVALNSQIIKKDSSSNLKTSLTIPNVMMISEGFYLGELADQFDFSVNDRMLQKFEVMDGVDQGIQLGLFKELGFEEQEIIKSLFIWMTQSRLVQVNVVKAGQLQETKVFKLHENLKLKMASAEWETFKSYCGNLKENKTTTRDFDLQDIQSSLVFGRLAKNIEANPATNEKGGSANLLGFFPYNGETTKSLEFLRTDISYVLLYMETLMDSLTIAGIDRTKIESEIEHFKSFYSEYLKDYLSVVAEFDECYFLKQKKEQEINFKIFEYEKKYWRYVLGKISGNQKILVDTIAPLSYQLPTGLKPRSFYANGGFQIFSIDFYYRIKQYMQFGLVLGEEKLPPIDSNVQIKFSSQMLTQPFYRDTNLKSVTLQNESTESKIQKIVTVHDFTGNTFVEWFAKGNIVVSKFIEQLDTLLILHRFGPGLKEAFGIESNVSLEHLTKTYHRVMHVFHLSDEMKSMLELVGIKEIADMDSMVNFGLLLKEKELALPFYDNILKSMSQSFIGYYGNDANFMGSGDSKTIRRPMQLLGTDYIMKLLYRYFDESYVSLFRDKKMDLNRYYSRMNLEMEISKRIVEYVDHVKKSRDQRAFTLQIRTNLSLSVPLYSVAAKNNLSAIVLDMNKKLNVIQNVKTGTR